MSRDSNLLSVFLAHRLALVDYASKIVSDRGHAEDVVQEAYLRFDSATDRKAVEQPVPYLYRIVRNLALDLRRKLSRDRDRHVPDAAQRMMEVAADRPSPEAEVGARDELRLMAAAMAELPDRTRLALELHRFGGCTFKEIAGELSISVGLAHALVIEGLEHCRERLFRK